MSKRSELLWRSFATAAAFVYLVAIFAPRFSVTYQGKSWLGALAETFTEAHGAWGSVFGIASLVICYLILVFALLRPRRSALSLEPLRTALALLLVAVTVVEILSRLPGYSHPALIGRFAFRGFGQLGYGAWAALGSSIALLLAVAVLDAGGLDKLLDRLPAWARLDRLEAPNEALRKPIVSATERNHRRWTGVLAVALIVYVLSLFTDWWWYSGGGNSSSNGTTFSLLNLFSGGETLHVDGFAGIGEYCALAALAALVAAGRARRRRERQLARLRTAFVAFVIGLTLVNVLVVWRQTYEVSDLHVTRSWPDYGALVTLGSMLLMLFATLVLNTGGLTKLIDRLPARARIHRLEDSPSQSDETA